MIENAEKNYLMMLNNNICRNELSFWNKVLSNNNRKKTTDFWAKPNTTMDIHTLTTNAQNMLFKIRKTRDEKK